MMDFSARPTPSRKPDLKTALSTAGFMASLALVTAALFAGHVFTHPPEPIEVETILPNTQAMMVSMAVAQFGGGR